MRALHSRFFSFAGTRRNDCVDAAFVEVARMLCDVELLLANVQFCWVAELSVKRDALEEDVWILCDFVFAGA
jgi:hypothetical protein